MLLNWFGGELDTWSAPGPTRSTGQTHDRIPDDLDGENAKTDDLRRIFGGLRTRVSRSGRKIAWPGKAGTDGKSIQDAGKERPEVSRDSRFQNT